MAYKEKSPIPVAEGGTGAATLTGVLTGNGTSAITANAVTNHGVLIGGASNAVSSLGVAATNTVLLGNTGADPSFGTVPNAALTNSSITVTGSGITVSGSPVSLGGTLTLTATGLGLTWNLVSTATTSSTNMVANNGYIFKATNFGAVSTAVLPTTASVGDVIKIVNFSQLFSGQVIITQATGQKIFALNSQTTTGATGTFTAPAAGESMTLLCVVANTTWLMTDMTGNWDQV